MIVLVGRLIVLRLLVDSVRYLLTRVHKLPRVPQQTEVQSTPLIVLVVQMNVTQLLDISVRLRSIRVIKLRAIHYFLQLQDQQLKQAN